MKIVMKKENIHKLFYLVCIFLIVGFSIRLGIDYLKYDNTNNSAPFYVFVIKRVIEFILLSIVAFIVGKVMKKKILK